MTRPRTVCTYVEDIRSNALSNELNGGDNGWVRVVPDAGPKKDLDSSTRRAGFDFSPCLEKTKDTRNYEQQRRPIANVQQRCRFA